MQRLVNGVLAFQQNVFAPMREFYEALADGQAPQALFIACSDSRISADLLTQTGPGDLFVLRNAGNLVPPHGASSGGESATIEYAVLQLGIKHIIVCGHSGCGAMYALMHPEAHSDMPAVSRWLHHAEATRLIMRDRRKDLPEGAEVDAASKANVIVQLENLRTHPSVSAAVLRGELFLHGWFYHFVTGQVYWYDPIQAEFHSINAEPPVSAVPPGRLVSELPTHNGDPRSAWIAECSAPRLGRFDPAAPQVRPPLGIVYPQFFEDAAQ